MATVTYLSTVQNPSPLSANDDVTITSAGHLTIGGDTAQEIIDANAWSANGMIGPFNCNGKVTFRNTTQDGLLVLWNDSPSIINPFATSVVEVDGDWIELGISNGTASQTFTHWTTHHLAGLWVETGDGTGIYEPYLNIISSFRPASVDYFAMTFSQVSAHEKFGRFFQKDHASTTITFGDGTSGYIPPNGARIRVPNIAFVTSANEASSSFLLGTTLDGSTKTNTVLNCFSASMSTNPMCGDVGSITTNHAIFGGVQDFVNTTLKNTIVAGHIKNSVSITSHQLEGKNSTIQENSVLAKYSNTESPVITNSCLGINFISSNIFALRNDDDVGVAITRVSSNSSNNSRISFENCNIMGRIQLRGEGTFLGNTLGYGQLPILYSAILVIYAHLIIDWWRGPVSNNYVPSGWGCLRRVFMRVNGSWTDATMQDNYHDDEAYRFLSIPATASVLDWSASGNYAKTLDPTAQVMFFVGDPQRVTGSLMRDNTNGSRLPVEFGNGMVPLNMSSSTAYEGPNEVESEEQSDALFMQTQTSTTAGIIVFKENPVFLLQEYVQPQGVAYYNANTGVAGTLEFSVGADIDNAVIMEFPFTILGVTSFQNVDVLYGQQTGEGKGDIDDVFMSYSLDKLDGLGWSAWKTTTGTNLAAEVLPPATTGFKMRLAVYDEGTDVNHPLSYNFFTNIDNTVVYPTVFATVIFTGIPENAEWRLYEDNETPGVNGIELAGVEYHSGGDVVYNYSLASPQPVVLQVMADGYEELRFNVTLGADDASYPLTLTPEINA